MLLSRPQRLFTLLVLLVLSCAPLSIQASHFNGAEITYECLGGNKYQVRLTYFEECGTPNPIYGSRLIGITNDCALPGPTELHVLLASPPFEVSQICASELDSSVCNGGPIPSSLRLEYEAEVVLPPCSSWHFTWSYCCRNTSTNGLGTGGQLFTVVTNFDNTVKYCDNSAVSAMAVIPTLCQNQPTTYDPGIYDPDGDSLSFQLVSALGGVGPIGYNAPYSGAIPMTGISINPFNGILTLNPPTLGNFIIAIEATQYLPNGTPIGTFVKDFEFYVINCALNNQPTVNIGISNLTGNSILEDVNRISVCAGSNFCFDMQFSDVNVGDTLNVLTDFNNYFPTGSVTVAGTNPITVTFCGTTPADTMSFAPVSIQIVDNNCQIIGQYAHPVGIHGLATSVQDAFFLCPDGIQEAQLQATGGNVFDWVSINGDPIIIGVNFSCNPCPNPVAKPTQATQYEVTSDLPAMCKNKDTVVVALAPFDVNSTLTISDGAICLGDTVALTVSISAGTVEWLPNQNYSSPTSTSTFGYATTPGTNYFVVEVSNLGCTKRDSIAVTVGPYGQFSATVISSDTAVCTGEQIQLDVVNLNALTLQCGPAASPCGTPNNQIQLGMDLTTNGTFSYPAVYGNFFWGAKNQMLYKASELNALGFSGGNINSIAFDVFTYDIGANIAYDNFQISLGCATVDSLTNWQPGLTTVYGPYNLIVAPGWNRYVLDVPYEWDGVTDLIVETCFNNNSFTSNALGRYSATPFTSVVYTRADNTSVCSSNTVTGSSPNRPNMRLDFCSPTPLGTGSHQFSWTPTAGLDDPTIPNPIATMADPILYTVVITESVGGCSDTAWAQLDIHPPPLIEATGSSAICPGESVILSATGGNQYLWTPALGLDNDTLADPEASPGSETVYTVLGTDANGCSDVDTVTVSFNDGADCSNFHIYTNITPNGDGENDLWLIDGVGQFPINHATIFNRWGDIVWQNDNYDNTTVVWGGENYNGESLPDGTYFYIFEAEGIDLQKGYVEINK